MVADLPRAFFHFLVTGKVTDLNGPDAGRHVVQIDMDPRGAWRHAYSKWHGFYPLDAPVLFDKCNDTLQGTLGAVFVRLPKIFT